MWTPQNILFDQDENLCQGSLVETFLTDISYVSMDLVKINVGFNLFMTDIPGFGIHWTMF